METLVTQPTTTTSTTEPVLEQTPAPMDWSTHVPKGSEKVFEPFKGKPLGDVLNSVVEAQKLIGGSIRLPKADALPAERDAILNDTYNKLGRPESPEKYDLGELPAISEHFKWDEARLNAAKGLLYKAGLTNDQAKTVIGLYGQELKAHFPDPVTTAHESKAKLIEEYGSESLYNRNLGFAKKTVGAYADTELVSWLETTGMGNHPPFVRLMAKIGRELQEHGAVDPATPQDLLSQGEAQKQVSMIMNDPKDLYFARPGTPGKSERMKEVQELYRIIAGEA